MWIIGSIEIDGIDIKDIGLSTLRSSIADFPQAGGDHSENFGPAKTSTDDDMWSALEKCKMKDTVMKYPEKLGHPVAEEGDNFSVGERQLFLHCSGLTSKAGYTTPGHDLCPSTKRLTQKYSKIYAFRVTIRHCSLQHNH